MTRPIFIIGCGRSGTSVLTWAIGQHPNIIVTPEINWVSTLASHLDGLYLAGKAAGERAHLTRWNVSRSSFFRAMGDGVDGVVRQTFEARFPNRRDLKRPSNRTAALRWYQSPDDPKSRWVDGTPSNASYASILAEMFPEAKFINLVRNPDDVLRSWLGISWRDKRHTSPRALLNHIYRSTEAGLMTHAALGREKVIRVLFEDLVSNPEETMREIMRFVGEEYVPECVAPILAGKMNSSGAASEKVEREFERVKNAPRLKELREWRLAARTPDWRISSQEAACKELEYYARYRLPMPGMIALPSRETLLRNAASILGMRSLARRVR